MSDMEIDDIQVGQPKQLTDRQLTFLVSLWRLNHFKQAPWSSWSILYSQRRPKRSKAPMLCFDTPTYDSLVKQREEELKKKQLHQHQIWQHVQDRLAEQNRLLEEEEEEQVLTKVNGLVQGKQQGVSGKKSKKQQKDATMAAVSVSITATGVAAADLALPLLSPTSSSTITSGSGSPETTPIKRSIRWGLQNNMTKKFDKTSPITLVDVPAFDKRPTKSALKVRTAHVIQKGHHHHKNPSNKTASTTATKAAAQIAIAAAANTNGPPARKQAMDFF
ncbi:hypothetical protein EDD21DRAFT_370381 [Dissophora ornata]|nr:hypothetical protein EDD21DRAFT_370381 [Dissophora ornata]